MNHQKSSEATSGVFLALLAGLWVLTSCGGSSSTSPVVTTPTPENNVQAVEVNLGPENNYVNGIFTTVTLCVPGTTNCQEIPNVLVDTGSYGLRLLSSAVTLSLPQVTQSGNDLQECVEYADGSYTWGPVSAADIQLAGEKASSVPIQIISAPNTGFPVPSACTSGGGPNDGTVEMLGSYGILGVGVFPQDCGEDCASASAAVSPYPYYLCSTSGVCEVAAVPLTSQVQNPVALFAQDNNGVLLTLPSVPSGGEATVSGSLIFGIGTESNNALGSATVYATDLNNYFTTTYAGTAYSESYVDSGSNAFYFLDSTTLGGIECADNPGWYCPPATENFTGTNTGYNGVGTGSFTFSIANADALVNTGNAAFNDLGGDNPGSFDFGLPFFYGRKVFVGIAGTAAPNGATVPYGYWAF